MWGPFLAVFEQMIGSVLPETWFVKYAIEYGYTVEYGYAVCK